MTSAPRRKRLSMVRETIPSLPGIGEAGKITVSPRRPETRRGAPAPPRAPSPLGREIDYLLQPVDVAGEGGHDQPAPGPLEVLCQGDADVALGGCIAGALAVGAVEEEGG